MNFEDPFCIKNTHNLFVHRFIDNNRVQSTTLMKLDSHSTLYHDGTENRYLTNLVAAGRNFIQVYAIFQNQLTLNLGLWELYEDILQIHQWQKTIVLSTKNKIIGLVYQDCILKNSFFLTLEFIELGFRQQIKITCDRNGYYMLVSTSRQILLCISQKAVHKYKAKPCAHRKMTIIEEPIKWNRPEYQSIVDIVKFEYYDFDLSYVEQFQFSDQFLFFTGYTTKNPNKKILYEIQIEKIFSDNEKESFILQYAKLDEDVKDSYVIRRENNQSQFFIVKKGLVFWMKNIKGEFMVEQGLAKRLNVAKNDFSDIIICKKNSNPLIFPLYVYHRNVIYIYERSPASGLSSPSYFTKKMIKLPESIQVQFCDIQDGIFSYCNMYELGLVYLRGGTLTKESVGETAQKQIKLQKIVLKQGFGNIIDFNIGQNIILVENTFKKKCSVRLLRKGISQNPKPFIMVPKKIALQKIPQVKSIRSLQQLLLNEYELTQCEQQLKRVKEILLNYLIIRTKDNNFHLYKLIPGPNYILQFSGFIYWTLVKNYQVPSKNSDRYELQQNAWYLIFYMSNSDLRYYQLNLLQSIDKNMEWLKLCNTHTGSNFIDNNNKISYPLVKTIKSYIISINQQSLTLKLFNWSKFTTSTINLPNGAKDPSANLVRVNYKSITFKKKDKDFFLLQVLVVSDCDKFQVWQVLVDSGLFKLSHTTQNVGEGLPIIFPSQSSVTTSNPNILNHQSRPITCPEYVLSDKTTVSQFFKSPNILKIYMYEYQTQNFLFLINSKQQLQVYKKVFCSNHNPYASLIANFNINTNMNNNLNIGHVFGTIETGFLYYRVPLQLNVIKKWKYNESTAFLDIGCGMLRICNFVFFKGEVLQFSENIRSCFKFSEDEIWALMADSKLKPLLTNGKIISHYLTSTIQTSLQSEIIGIESTNQTYVIYSKSSFEVFDKQLNSTWVLNLNQGANQNVILQNKQSIITLCAFDHYVAMSYCNYCEDQSKNEYKSIKFKLRIYNTITKKKIIEKQNAFEQPVLHIRYVPPDKLIIVTSSNISVNTIKNNQTLQNPKNRHYSKRGMLSCFSYHPEKVGHEPGYMIFGGLYGGLSFYMGKWIEQDKLDEIWFENLKCGARQIQIFHYGGPTQGLKAIVADDTQNIIILDLKPRNAQKIADFHIGSPINMIKKRNEIPYFSSNDGCIRMILPIKLKDPEVSFLDFQQDITKIVPVIGGFNNRDTRLLDQRQRTYKISPESNMVDGQIIKSFFGLTQTLKNYIFDLSDLTVENLKNQLLAPL